MSLTQFTHLEDNFTVLQSEILKVAFRQMLLCCAVSVGMCSDTWVSVSRIVPWWVNVTRSLTTRDECVAIDSPVGLQLVTFRPPANFQRPDSVCFSCCTMSVFYTTQKTMDYVREVLIELDPNNWYYSIVCEMYLVVSYYSEATVSSVHVCKYFVCRCLTSCHRQYS